MCAVAAICGFTKIRTTRSCRRTASAPIDAISARGGRRPRTHSGQRRHVSNHNRAFPQVGDTFECQSVNTVKPSAEVFTFRADLGEHGLVKVLPTG
jgi:hypothetical protein